MGTKTETETETKRDMKNTKTKQNKTKTKAQTHLFSLLELHHQIRARQGPSAIYDKRHNKS
jgi:hypothetical protein